MKKYVFIVFIYFSGLITSCCSNYWETTYHTIETVEVRLFSVDKNDEVLDYIDSDNLGKIALLIQPDSVVSRLETAANFSTISESYACDDNDSEVFTNSINYINVVTVFDYDEEHPAGSNINDLLGHFSYYGGEFRPAEVNSRSSPYHQYEFATLPQNDTLQLHISGRITDKGNFLHTTDLIVFE